MTKHEVFEAMGYTDLREVNGMTCGLYRYIFTSGVCIGLDESGIAGRFCFDSMQNARLFLEEWDGESYPTVGDDGCTAIKYVR